MVVLDCESGKVVATAAIGDGVDGAAFDPSSGCAFASNGDGTLTVVHEEAPGKFTVLQNAETARGARTLALDLRTHIVYLPAAEYEEAPKPQDGTRPGRPKMLPGSFKILVFGR